MNDTNNQVTFPSWEQLTRREQLLSEISDTYKSINGIRPRWNMDHMTDNDLQTWLDSMHVEISQQIEAERNEELAHEKAMYDAFIKVPWTMGEILRLS